MATETYREPAALAALRFALELLAWLAIYFAWGLPALVLAVALLSLLNVRGDKHIVVIAIPGKLRIIIEVAVFVAGIVAASRIWTIPPAGLFAFAVAVLLVSSRRRMRWLWFH